MHDIRSGHRRDTLVTPWNLEAQLVLPQWKRQEPDGPPADQQDMENIVSGCQSQKRRWCRQWPLSCHGNPETETEEKWTWHGKTTKKLKEPRAKSTFTLQLKNKFKALTDQICRGLNANEIQLNYDKHHKETTTWRLPKFDDPLRIACFGQPSRDCEIFFCFSSPLNGDHLTDNRADTG